MQKARRVARSPITASPLSTINFSGTRNSSARSAKVLEDGSAQQDLRPRLTEQLAHLQLLSVAKSSSLSRRSEAARLDDDLALRQRSQTQSLAYVLSARR